MLGKIIKHEFKATYKTALTMILSVLLVGGLVRMMDMVSFDGTIWRIIEMIMAVFYLLLLIAVPVSMFVVSIARFYRTMVKDEGYLTHTIPVKKTQLINGKLITSVIWIIISIMVIPLSLLINVKNSIYTFRDIAELLKLVFSNSTYIMDCVMFILLIIVSIMTSLLLCYASIGMGQMFNGHRLAGSVLFYFIFKYAFSFLQLFLMLIIPSVADMMNKYDTVNKILMAEDNGMLALMLFVMPFQIILGIICYLIAYWRFSKKLNLE
ncbi:hypothetical protein ACTNBM_08895 [Lachnospiraceae bacterium HCP1S3_C3]|nr:hypothetical protein [Lachnospiraceae bacterium]MDD6858211.1 hypothetical protein [Lachnospiraceae bacterium]